MFGFQHPDPLRFSGDLLEDELQRTNGAIVGELSDARIDMKGHPKLMAKQNFSTDTAERLYRLGKISKATFDRTKAALDQIHQLLADGKLSLSTAFLCPDNGMALTGVAQPNHVLCFGEDPQNMPKDRGSVYLNKADPLETRHIPGHRVVSARCPTCGHIADQQTPGETVIPGQTSFRSSSSRSP